MHLHPEPIAQSADLEELKREAAFLQRRGALVAQGRFDVLLAAAWEIPATLHEIGRLREITFRAVGEGTGKSLDLDRFDASYLHLYVWDREACQIAGAYRLGCSDVLLASGGPDALYTSTLFRFEKPFLEVLKPALELGRSFVTTEYQKSIYPLSLLWKGIGRFVMERPRYSRLFGPVSISSDYSSLSRDLMVSFMRNTHQDERLAGLIQPVNPYKMLHDQDGLSAGLKSIEEVSAVVARCEPDGKGVPVLLKQYLRLNAILLEFNIDPDFGDALDALVLVDLREAPAVMLQRYMGAEGYESFMAALSAQRVA